ncbi:MAG: hypothetical protein ACO1SX_18395 [Actinomycetota bacterium]
MSKTFRGHFDGKVIVLDEPVQLPLDQSLELEWKGDLPKEAGRTSERQRARARLLSRQVNGPEIPLEALRREALYGDEA